MKILARLARIVALTAAFTIATTLPASATCRAEPFSGDVYHSTSSVQSLLYIDTGYSKWYVPRGSSSDATITPGHCEDVDYVYLPSGKNIQQDIGGGIWSTLWTSTGWHQIHGGNYRLRVVYE